MPLFSPNHIEHRITKIPAEYFEKSGVKGIVLDVDNTLSIHGGQIPLGGVIEWIADMKNRGYQIVIASNACRKRVKPFANKLGLAFVYMSCKPLPFGFIKARKLLGLKKSEIAMIGDQIFTDVLGGNLYGFQTVLVMPIVAEKSRIFEAKRRIERMIIARYHKNHN